ncbi:MAG: sulfurtransferase TusA family protein [Bacillota bacterium]|nr:sulfurtransferase TusA family protein [Bacillota bacterium]
MKREIDARGLSCPLPVLRTRAALEEGCEEVEVRVDSGVARENVTVFARGKGYSVKVNPAREGEWLLYLRKEG